jgi:23S rRNA (guanosine2251-2'-O)-methyltransferase
MKAGGRDYGLGGEQVEGHHAVHQLLVAGRRRARRIWVADAETRSEPVQRITQLANERRVPVQIRPGEAVLATARTGAPQGVIAWADPVLAVELDELLETSALTGPPFLLVLDGVTDPGNFGSLLRTAACAGVGGVVVGRHRSAPLTPAAVKAAAGAVEHVPIASAGGIPAALQRLNRSGLWLVGLDPFGADEVWSATLFDGPVALVLGSEGKGLSRLAGERCHSRVRIPQQGPLGSLNVAAAAAVACFEVARRRAGTSNGRPDPPAPGRAPPASADLRRNV